MKKLLLATVAMGMAAVVTTQAAKSQVNLSNNIQAGCWTLATALVQRIEEMDTIKAQCPDLKRSLTSDKDGLIKCMIGAAVIYNRARHVRDLEELPVRVGNIVTKGCYMIVFDSSERDAQLKLGLE
jgi:hypothetical protein